MKLLRWFRQLFQKDFVQDFSILLSGTALASLLPLLFSPLISRLFTPEQFGVFGIVTAAAGAIGNIAGGRYELAVMLPKRAIDSKHLVLLVTGLSFFFSVAAALLLLPFYHDLIQYFELEYIGNTLLIVPLLMVLISVQKAFTFWLNRNRNYKASAFGKVVQGLSVSVFTILLGLLSFEDGLIVGYAIGWSLYVLSLMFFAWKNGFGGFKPDFLRMKRLAHHYSSFPRWNVLFTFLNDTASYLVIFLITGFFTVEETGYYNFSRQYLFVPLSLVSIALSNVYFQRIARKVKEKDSLKKEYFDVLKLLFSAGIVVSLVLYITGAEFFELIFGDEWRYSGFISEVLIFGFVIKFIASPFGQLLIVLNRLKLALLFPLLYVALMLSLTLFSQLSFEGFIKVLVVFEVIAYSFYLALSYRSLTAYELNLKKKV